MKMSVIIPCFNSEKFIYECLNPVLETLSAEDEVICIDDGSEDCTRRILNEITDSRLNVIAQQNKGPGAARNAGIDAASGDQIFFVDSDDVISSSMIAAVKSQLQENVSTCQVCLQVTRERRELENIRFKQIMELNTQMVLSAEEVKLSILNADYPSAKRIYKNGYDICGPVAKTYCREILDAYHIRFPEDLRWGEDICFNLQYISHIREVRFVPVKAYWYRTVSNSLINRYYPEKFQEILYFTQTVHEILKDGKKEEQEAFNFLAVKQYLYILQFDLCNHYNPEPFESRKQKAWALKEENILIREGIGYCKKQCGNAGIRLMILLLRLKWFRAVDFIMKLYTWMERAE